MSITQATLIGTNLTTVEHLSVRSMRERERTVLSRMHGILSFRAKKQTMKDWNDDWGRIGKEGNIFWREGARENWRGVMGGEKLGWICGFALTRFLLFNCSVISANRQVGNGWAALSFESEVR
jgi:hypothetical protein